MRSPQSRATAAVVLVSLAIIAARAPIPDIHGRVVAIADGDTLTVLDVEKTQHKIRLADIDAPEKKQPFGTKSKESLAELTFGKDVRVVVVDIDRYKRVVGRIYVFGSGGEGGKGGEIHVNAEQLKRGMAWVYKQYCKDAALYEVESTAKAEGQGLWSDPNAQPPWEWRRKKRPK